MYSTPTAYLPRKDQIYDSLTGLPSSIEEMLPTMDKRLSNYFEGRRDALLEEWGILTRNDLDGMEMRLDRLSMEIGKMETSGKNLKARAGALDFELQELERS
ncbi:MAG: hypothetical protein LUQ01_04230 [Methanolinea sp.]|nr:hypothetical protein [Methanolinea sp.]